MRSSEANAPHFPEIPTMGRTCSSRHRLWNTVKGWLSALPHATCASLCVSCHFGRATVNTENITRLHRGQARAMEIWPRIQDLLIKVSRDVIHPCVQLLISLIKGPAGCTAHASPSCWFLGGFNTHHPLTYFFFFSFAIAQSQRLFSKRLLCQKGFWKLPCCLSGAG